MRSSRSRAERTFRRTRRTRRSRKVLEMLAHSLLPLAPHPDGAFMNSELVSELYCDGVLTGDGRVVRLDRIGSVSGLTRLDIPEVR